MEKLRGINMPNRWNVDRIMRFILLTGTVVLIVLVLNYLSGVLAPFAAAFVIAYIVNPLVDFLQKKMRYRILAVLTVLVSAAVFLTGALWLFVPRIMNEMKFLGTLITKVFYDAEWSSKLTKFVPEDVWLLAQEAISWDKIASAMQTMDFWNAVQTVASKLISGTIGVFSGTAMVIAWFTGLSLILLYLIFIMLDMPRLQKSALALIPERFQHNAKNFAEETNRFMSTYFRSQTIVASLVGCLFATAFSIIGFPLGLMFGLFIGLLNMVPYLQIASIPIAFLLAIIYSLNSGIPFWEVVLLVTGIYVVIQLLQDLILVPSIVGKNMNLPPVGILLSLSVWGKLLGFLGLIVAIPFTCICLVYIQKISAKSNEMIADDSENSDQVVEKRGK